MDCVKQVLLAAAYQAVEKTLKAALLENGTLHGTRLLPVWLHMQGHTLV